MFDVVIELNSKEVNMWTVILDVENAVDRILSGRKYEAQVRRRNADTGSALLELVEA